MALLKIVLLIVYGSCLVCGRRQNPSSTFTVENPLIEVFSPRGLKVSIPDAPGIQLFAFHGNINKPMNGIEAGELSKDILRKEDDRWVFRDGNVNIRRGDVIYFWFYVLKDGLGYRFDNGEFRVREISRKHFMDNSPVHRSECHDYVTPEAVTVRNEVTLSICEKTVLNLTNTLIQLHREMGMLRETNSILKDLVEKHPETTKWLKVFGKFPPDENPVTTIQEFLRLKLDLSINVVNATRCKTDTCIRFEVDRLRDKIDVVRAAKDKLSSSKFTISY